MRPSRSVTIRSSGVMLSYGTPLGLITTLPDDRSNPLALPNVKITNPWRTKSWLASNTSSLSVFKLITLPLFARRFFEAAEVPRRSQLERTALHRTQNRAAYTADIAARRSLRSWARG